MPLELLREIAKKTLPLDVDNTADIDKLRVLHAAGHVKVEFADPSSQNQHAKVLAITAEGRAALQRLFDAAGNQR
jgi:hypothetical protein